MALVMPANGAGIYQAGSSHLRLDNLTLYANHANGDGGGIHSISDLTIHNSTIINNQAGIPGINAHKGGGIYSSGSFTLTNVNLTGNKAIGSYPGGGLGGGIHHTGSGLIQSSLFANNHGSLTGAGLGVYGGTTHVVQTTFDSNHTGGVGLGGGIYLTDNGTITVTHSTLANNSGVTGVGGGIYNYSGMFYLRNSVLSNSDATNCHGNITSLGYNLSDDNSCALSGNGDVNNTPRPFR